MNQETFLSNAVVYLGAALLTVPIARHLGLGSVLGYLLAGLIVGPWGLGFIGEESEQVQHFAEFGVVMMLFLVGLELEPSRLWRLRGPIFGLGGMQVLGTAGLVCALSMALGLSWKEGAAMGLILAMSSTAIALQSLAERGLSRADSGQKAFAVLLFQDLAVIPILALMPALATHPRLVGDDHGHGGSLADSLPPWAYALLVLAAVATVVLGGRFLCRPAFRFIARTGMREMFTAGALLLVVGVAQLMTLVGLSAALGTFLAGVVLAESEYRHELESDIEPFKGLLLGVFFIAVGSSINVGVLQEHPFSTLGLLLGVLSLKGLLLLALARHYKASWDQSAWFAAALAGVGEFAFVLFGFAEREGVLTAQVTTPIIAVTALSMAATPVMLLLVERVVLPRLLSNALPTPDSDVEDHGHDVIIAGYGRFGQIAGRFLSANGVGITTVDVDGEQIEMLRRFGNRVYYGDASRLDLLTAAGAARAKLLIVAVDEHEKVMQIVTMAREHFPHLAILARARGRTEAYDLHDAKIEGIYRETFDSALRLGTDAMRLLGASSHRAHRAAQTFRRFDEGGIAMMAALRNDQERLVSTARERVALLERTLKVDRENADELGEEGWDSDALRNVDAVK